MNFVYVNFLKNVHVFFKCPIVEKQSLTLGYYFEARHGRIPIFVQDDLDNKNCKYIAFLCISHLPFTVLVEAVTG